MNFSSEEINEFKGEALELFLTAEASLLLVDKGADLRAHYDTILRCFHNIKGAASIIESETLQSKMHELENLLTPYFNQGSIPPEKVDLLLGGVDAGRSILNAISPPNPVAGPAQKGNPDPKPSQDPSPISDASMNEFFSECDEIVQRLSLNFNKIESEGHSQAIIDSVYRDIHTLKGSAQLFGFKQLGSLAHGIESNLDPIREQRAPLPSQFVDALYKGLDLIERMIADIRKKSGTDFRREVEALALEFTQTLEKNPDDSKEHVQEPASHSGVEDSASKDSSTTIRVPVALLDRLMSLVSEMVLIRNQVIQFSNKNDDLEFINLSQQLNVVTGEIQEELMKTRMQPIGNILSKFHRIVRDLTKELGKNILLTLEGSETELDKTLLEAVKDPLTHIIRNCCDHGIESLQERVAAKKKKTGSIHVKAYHEGGQVIVSVSDDGRGLDRTRILAKAIEKGLISSEQSVGLSEREIFQLVFVPGFSTAERVSNISGRGVGMDVVKSNIERIGGSVELESEFGKGTTIRLKIPLTLAIVPAMIIRSQRNRYAIPQSKLVELVRVGSEEGKKIEYLQGKPVYRLRGKLLPLLELKTALGLGQPSQDPSPRQDSLSANIVVLSSDKQIFGLIVDEILDTADIVVKPLSKFLKSLMVYSGATVLGDGSVALILDVLGLARQQFQGYGTEEATDQAGGDAIDARLKSENAQDFILFKLNSPTKHALPLGYVNRLEEFKATAIEYSGQQRVIRYRNSVLPLFSLNEMLNYPFHSEAQNSSQDPTATIHVIVVQKGRHLFGLEVNETLDTLSTDITVNRTLESSIGIYGNLVTEEGIVSVIDLDSTMLGKMSGSLDRSKPGVTFERQTSIQEPFSALEEKNHEDASSYRRDFKILFVEDTAFIRKHVGALLERVGYQVISVNNGEEALQALNSSERNPFNLVISDIEMPKMDGFQLSTQIRQDPRWKHLPVIALSSKTDSEFVKRGIQAGFTLYLEKRNSDRLILLVDQIAMNQRGAA